MWQGLSSSSPTARPSEPDNLGPGEQLQRISGRVHDLVDDQYRVLNDMLIPALEGEHIRFIRRRDWGKRHADWIKRYFARELVPVLSPIALDPAHRPSPGPE